MVTDHDLPVDLIATPRAVIEVERVYERPRGILWDHLQPPQIHEIPILERMGYRLIALSVVSHPSAAARGAGRSDPAVP